MKIKKLLSLMMMMDDRFHFDSAMEVHKDALMGMVEQQYQEVMALKAYVEARAINFEDSHPELPKQSAELHLSVSLDDGLGTCAQVKLYPMSEKDSLASIDQADHRISMILATSHRDGDLKVTLPMFRYVGYESGTIELEAIKAYGMIVNKGSAYKSVRKTIHLQEATESYTESVLLERLIDLESMGWYAGDLHHHSVYSSPLYGGTDDVSESADEVARSMMGQGLAFGALSDHHNILNHKDWMAMKRDDFLPMPSKEISTSNGHVMALACYDEVTYRIPEKSERTKTYLHDEFVRIVDQIKGQGGMAQINHPKDLQKAISLSAEMEPFVELFDTMEIWNGSVPMHKGTSNQHAYQLWLKLLGEDRYVPATTGSDTHNTRADDYNGLMDWLMWLKFHLSQALEMKALTGELEASAKAFIQLLAATLEPIELWAEASLGTACVRTFLHIDKKATLSQEGIVHALSHGHSFLSNGPILIPSVQGKSCGDLLEVSPTEQEVTLACQIIQQVKLDTLEVIGKKGLLAQIDLRKQALNKPDSVSLSIDMGPLKDKDWLVVKAYSDHRNMVITNPIFIHKVKGV